MADHSRMVHIATKLDDHGNVSALCFDPPRVINMRRHTWTLDPDWASCRRCKRIHMDRSGYKAKGVGVVTAHTPPPTHQDSPGGAVTMEVGVG